MANLLSDAKKQQSLLWASWAGRCAASKRRRACGGRPPGRISCLAAETEGRGVAVFAFGPGVVRTSITDYLTASPNVPEAVGKRFRAFLDQKRDAPIERCAQMLLFLVSGRVDALTGRFIRAQDNEDELVRRVEEIRRDDLYVVTLRTRG
jgi:hypothetical protein